MKRKVCVVTGTRAEYGLLYWTLKRLRDNARLELQLIITGMHLSPEFGLTYRKIQEDGFHIDKKVEMLMSSDTPQGITKSMGLGMIGFSDALEDLRPDLLLILGDRYEIFAMAAAAMVHRIPIAHCHGGETTEGVIDESIRHSITKMSHIHFCATEVFRNRIIQLGEHPRRVYNVGALGIENINRLELLDREQLEAAIDFKLGKRNLLVTFHPVTLENASSGQQFSALLEALDELEDTHLIFTKANSDTDGRIINQMIDEYTWKNPHKSIGFQTLGQLRYLSAIQFMDAVVGNSSSGLIEVPSFRKPTINIGDRQKGRIMAQSVINCHPDYHDIKAALQKAINPGFLESLEGMPNPYDNGNSSETIVSVLAEIALESLLKKEFFDLSATEPPVAHTPK